MNDAAAVLLLRCADSGHTYWDWTDQDWLDLLGRNHKAFQKQMPAWAEGAVRPFVCGHAYHLGGFSGFNRLGHFDRLTLACRIFGRQLVEEEIGRVRAVLTGWGYQYGQDHDKGVPSVMSQLFRPRRGPTEVGHVGGTVDVHDDHDPPVSPEQPVRAVEGRPVDRRGAAGSR
ncbi:hypothetical protein [Streptomyces scabiei]|uniref:hypothetical protein n=1 Tax=Streptomyces scabiei TaxID=1930 RepID=UPI000A5B8CDD|nr:hypothetical protein [Streptomyces scabiei]